MNKKLKSHLQTVFDAPTPTRKEEFLQSINFPKTSYFDFILGQIGYIRKRVWVASCLLVLALLLGLQAYTNYESLHFIWIVSSILPFVSLLTITEIVRSSSHNMSELEMSCKYNLADIILVRLGTLSCFNAVILGLIIFLLRYEFDFMIFRLVVYMLVPFILTCSLSLFIINHFSSKETSYICCATSCSLSMANVIFSTQYKIAFLDEYLFFWGLALIFLMVWLVTEIMKLIKKTEELQWNLL